MGIPTSQTRGIVVGRIGRGISSIDPLIGVKIHEASHPVHDDSWDGEGDHGIRHLLLDDMHDGHHHDTCETCVG